MTPPRFGRLAPLTAALLAAGCYSSHAPSRSVSDAGLDAAATRPDVGPRPDTSCGCPCTDASRACRGRPDTVVTLASLGSTGTTAHRARRSCIEITYDPSVPYPDAYEAALRDWMRDCPAAFCLEEPRPRAGLPRYACRSAIHFAPVGASDAEWGTCSGSEGAAGFIADTATGEIHEACIEVARPEAGLLLRALGSAMGLDFAAPDVESVMANPAGAWPPRGLSSLDRAGFCAAYGGVGHCAD